MPVKFGLPSVSISSARNHQSGVALIEILITIVVIAFGLLGLLSLQARTMVTATQANYQFVASTAAQEMGERIRADAESAASYNMGANITATDRSAISGACSGVCLSGINQWMDDLAGDGTSIPVNGISGAEARVVVVTAAGITNATVTISWPVGETDTQTYIVQMPINTNIKI